MVDLSPWSPQEGLSFGAAVAGQPASDAGWNKKTGQCHVCFGPHNVEIHAATLSVHQWFRDTVTRYLDNGEDGAASFESVI